MLKNCGKKVGKLMKTQVKLEGHTIDKLIYNILLYIIKLRKLES